MGKDFRTLMRERRQTQTQGVPQVDPDDVVVERMTISPLSTSADHDQVAGEPREVPHPPVIGAPELVKVGTVMRRDRHRQVKQEALDTDSKEWEVIDRALETYFRAKREAS